MIHMIWINGMKNFEKTSSVHLNCSVLGWIVHVIFSSRKLRLLQWHVLMLPSSGKNWLNLVSLYSWLNLDKTSLLGFKFDNILMEESAQILEIETFIPLLLQNPEDGFNRLKRWIMIGDHHQLPPVIKNQAFQKYSNMEQSLFTRFVRLGESQFL